MTFLLKCCRISVPKVSIIVNSRTCSTLSQYVDVPSALHLIYKHKKNVFQPVSPCLENIDYFEDIPKLKSELNLRGIEKSFAYLETIKNNCQLYIEITETFTKLKLERNKIHNDIKFIKDKNKQDENALLQYKLRECCEQIDVMQRKTQDLEKDYVLPYLNLPNRIHPSTTTEDVELVACFEKPPLMSNLKSHLNLCLQLKEISVNNVSPNSCYLLGNLAILELALTEFVLTHSKKLGYRPLTVTDFAKAVLAEGCGLDLKSNKEILEIHDWDCVSSSLKSYLVGGASLPCSVALICKLIKNPNYVQPFKSICVGRKYTPLQENQSVNLYNTLQTTAASTFILYSSNSKEEGKMFDESITLVTELYRQFGLHFILKRYSASKLKKHESLAVGICMFSPITNSYMEVGRISLCGDYISRRLQCIEGLGQKKGAFLGMIHVEVINITKWIACMIENTQTSQGSYLIPKCLKPYMFEAQCLYC